MSSNFILKYSSSLLPTFKKDRIVEDARVVETELSTNTIPVYQSSADMFAPRLVKSKEASAIMKNYFSIVGGNNSKGMVADIADRLKNVHENVVKISDLAQKDFETSIVVDGITLYKVSLIKALELCGFISRYSLRLLNYMYILEASAVNKQDSYVSQQLSKGEIKELELYMSDFCRAIKSMSKDPKSFQKDLDSLPSVSVGPMSEATLANIGSTRLDPANIFAVNGFISPVYRFGMMIAEIQVSRYKEAKELKTNLELRKIFLENLRATGQFDEATQKEIDIIQSRIDRCTEKIRKAEESVGM